ADDLFDALTGRKLLANLGAHGGRRVAVLHRADRELLAAAALAGELLRGAAIFLFEARRRVRAGPSDSRNRRQQNRQRDAQSPTPHRTFAASSIGSARPKSSAGTVNAPLRSGRSVMNVPKIMIAAPIQTHITSGLI